MGSSISYETLHQHRRLNAERFKYLSLPIEQKSEISLWHSIELPPIRVRNPLPVNSAIMARSPTCSDTGIDRTMIGILTPCSWTSTMYRTSMRRETWIVSPDRSLFNGMLCHRLPAKRSSHSRVKEGH